MRHVPHVFVASPWDTDVLVVEDHTRRHLGKVLRLTAGAAITYTDGAGRFGEGRLEVAGIRRGAERIEPHRMDPVTVAVCPPKDSARVRFVVEKLAELGTDRLWWLHSERSEGRPPREEKAQAWAIAALEQSRGAWLLEISGPVTLEEVAATNGVLAAVPGGSPLREMTIVGPVVVCIGPEGGFAPEELPAEVQQVGLGFRVLRVETAALVAATLLVTSPSRRR